MSETLLAVDVHYHDAGGARAAGVLARWDASVAEAEWTVDVAEVAPYETGAFYRRELPCLLALLAAIPARPGCIVVDGHAWLDGRPGLGAHLHDATGLPVVGVAKHRYAGGSAVPVLRGQSRSPLYVSTAGFPLDTACERVRAMHGEHRLPTLLKRVDWLCRHGGALEA